ICKWPWFTWPRAKCKKCSRKKSGNSRCACNRPTDSPPSWRPGGPRPPCRNQGRGKRASVFHPRCRRNALMTCCPSDEKLTGLLADALSTAERDALAQHVEGCAACQEQLALLTATPDRQMWRRAEHPTRGSRAEDAMMRRLKRRRPRLAAIDPMQA